MLGLLFFCLTSCSLAPRIITYDAASLAEDHTIGIASNPFTSMGMLLSRIKIFTTETLWRTHIKLFCYPFLQSEIPPISNNRSYLDKEKFNRWLDKKIGNPVKGNIRIFISGNNFFPILEENILNAEKYVNLSTYIFDNDQYGIYFADLLRRKSKTVQIKVIADLLGSVNAWENSKNKENSENQKSPDIFLYLMENSKIKLRKSRNIWLTSDHIKMIIIDGKKVFFGGMNIGNEYRYDWRDMMFEVKGDLTMEFKKIFYHAWYKHSLFSDFLYFFQNTLKGGINKDLAGSTEFHVLKTTTYKHEIYNAQLEAARRAKHHIYVENPYLWNEAFLYELCAARNRGVDVRVTIPGKLDAKNFSGINKRVANILMSYGVRVFIYPGTSHIKAASFDGWVCFGTANYDDLSLHKNREVDLATSDSQFSKKLEQQVLLEGQNLSSELREPYQIEVSDWLKYKFKNYL